MHKLIIHNLGPVTECELSSCQFMTLTGCQASGKSTIAKAVYYFRTVKDDIFEIVSYRAFDKSQDNNARKRTLTNALTDFLRKKFLKTFGPVWGNSTGDMQVSYIYNNECRIDITLKPHNTNMNFIYITFSPVLIDFLRKHEQTLTADITGIPEIQKRMFQAELRTFFKDDYETIYIPAGRSMLSLLSQQLDYLYRTMNESQKQAIDYCTQIYLEKILTLKSEFSIYEGVKGLATFYNSRIRQDVWEKAIELSNSILCGSYRADGGEERITLDNGSYVKINFASSGQQDIVWVINLLFYYLIQPNRPAMFIIEEPESHLFPSSQKYIMELIALVCNQGHSVLVTTHSPYVLGALNNLLYASQFRKTANQEAASKIIPSSLWLAPEKFSAYFVKDGRAENCIDSDMNLIQNERIDEIASVINAEYDRLLELDSINEEEDDAD